MLKFELIKKNLIQLYSLIIKDLKLHTRYKSEAITESLAPLLTIFFPYIIFNTLFNINSDIFGGYYSIKNFLLFILLGYCISVLIFLLWYYKDLFYDEKIWKTLESVMIAPVNKINILLSYMISGLIYKSIPVIIIFILCIILYPVSLLFILLTLMVLFSIAITFASMGFILGIFEIVNEDISASLSVGISFIALLSCLYYPITIFPEEIQFFIRFNPLYYYFDLLRLVYWAGIDYKNAISYITIMHVLVVIIFTIFAPILASFFFLKLYRKYGVSGY